MADIDDNCSLAANESQIDFDGDGFGNACDADLNNDGIINILDLAILKLTFFSTVPSAADLNGDGQVNVADLGIMKTLFYLPPGPGPVSTQ